jgi:hypothetical protein
MNGHYPKDRQLHQTLNNLLDSMELEVPSSALADRIMRVVQYPDAASANQKQKPLPIPKRRPEFLHVCVASAATYFFIQSGILQDIAILPDSVNRLSAWIEHLSSLIGS